MTEHEIIQSIDRKVCEEPLAHHVFQEEEINFIRWILNRYTHTKREPTYEIVCTDEYGREHRSPLTKPFCVKYDGDSQTEEYHIFVRKEWQK